MEVLAWLAVLMTVLLAATISVTWLVASRRRGPGTPLIRLAPPTASAASDLGRLDSFSEPALRARLTELFRDVDQAWSGHRLTDLEPDVTIDLLAAWTARPPAAPPPLQLALEEVTARVVEAQAGASYEHLTVSLDGGERQGVPALQYWTLERGRRGAIRGQTCTGCGAPLVLDLRGRCASCGATIDVGRLAWILARVETARDWSTRELDPDQDALEGLEAIATRDAAFDPDTFIDRVMALYPHLAQAIRDPSNPLGQVAIAPDLRRDLGAMEAARHRVGRRAVVDSVTVSGVAIWSAGHRGDRGFITVDVAGTAAHYELDAAGRLVAGDRVPHAILDRWTFVRAAGVMTSGHGGVLAEACPACGAPIGLDENGRCRFCGAETTLGNRDWVLTDIAYRADQREDDPHKDGRQND